MFFELPCTAKNNRPWKISTEMKKHMKVIKTFNLYLSMFTLGLSMPLTGPFLLDLQRTANTDKQPIAASTGYLIGAIVGGFLLDVIKYRQAVLMVFNLFMTVAMIGIPWSRSGGVLMGFVAMSRMSHGAIETGGNVMCLILWGKDSGPFLQGLHFAFGLGGLMSFLIAATFHKNFDFIPSVQNSTYSYELVFNSTDKFYSNISDVTPTSEIIPKTTCLFSFIGSIAVSVVVLYLVVCIISPMEDVTGDGEVDHSDRGYPFLFCLAIATYLAFFVEAIAEIGYAQTLTTYTVKERLRVTTTSGSFMILAFWAAFTLSRLVFVVLAIKFSSLALLVGDICIVSVAAFILMFLMPKDWALWLVSVIFGAGIGPTYATMLSWVSTHINVTYNIAHVFTVSRAGGEMIVPVLIAFFKKSIPEMFAFVLAAFSSLMTVLGFILYCMFKTGEKYPKVIECYGMGDLATSR